MKLSDVYRQLSVDLNDAVPGYEFTVWRPEQLTNYVWEGLTVIGKTRPDWFTEPIIVPLEPGQAYQKVCDCNDVRRIIGQCDANGVLIKPLVKKLDAPSMEWPAPESACLTAADTYVMHGYSINSDISSAFRIYPTPPAGATKYVLVECFSMPAEFTDDTEIDNNWYLALKMWSLFRALSIDAENNPAIAGIAKQYEDDFWKIIGIDNKNFADFKKREEYVSDIRPAQSSSAE